MGVGAILPAMTAPQVRLVALGGLGEIGMNCLVLEQDDEAIVIDCGVTFADGALGADVIVPRLDHLLARPKRVRGVVITHGHEDHIGGLPYLLDELDLPVWAPPHAMSLIRHRLAEWHFDVDSMPLNETRTGTPFRVGPFEIESIRVTHSIADATALAIKTAAGTVIHTGDFKLDPHPADGELTDEARFSALGDEGVALLLSDSTNVDSRGNSGSELDVGGELAKLVESAPARVIVGIFASNVQRLLHLGEIAMRSRRRIVLLGRSVQNHARIATLVGRLGWPSDLVVSPEIGQAMPRKEILVIATGTQAEPVAALGKLARGEHPKMRLEEGDVVAFSSRIIPGNDRAVYDLYGAFLRRGITVASRATHPGIHASGHAHAGELSRMIELVRPRAFMPVHGTLHHLHRHAELARSLGVDDVVVAENGELVGFEGGKWVKNGRTPVGRVLTLAGLPIPDEVLRERVDLAKKGALFVALTLDGTRLAATPKVEAVGVVGPLERDVLARVERAAEHAALRVLGERGDGEELVEQVRSAARKIVESHVAQRPFVVVTVARLGARA